MVDVLRRESLAVEVGRRRRDGNRAMIAEEFERDFEVGFVHS
jgi:hypothetical protein